MGYSLFKKVWCVKTNVIKNHKWLVFKIVSYSSFSSYNNESKIVFLAFDKTSLYDHQTNNKLSHIGYEFKSTILYSVLYWVLTYNRKIDLMQFLWFFMTFAYSSTTIHKKSGEATTPRPSPYPSPHNCYVILKHDRM
jgi:hypothetical protein